MTSRGVAAALLAAAAFLSAASPARAGDGDSLVWNAYAQFTAGHGFNRAPGRVNTLRVFDGTNDAFTLDVAQLTLQVPCSRPGEGGARVDLAAGSSVPRVCAASGLFRDPATGAAQDVDLRQAYVSWIANAGAGVRFDAGKWVTPFGYELIEGWDGWNDQATRSLLFGWAIPFTHTGVRASGALGGHASGMLGVVNGWDDAVDENGHKSVLAQVTLTPGAGWTVIAGGITGIEGADSVAARRSLVDAIVTWKPGGRWSLAVDADFGTQQHGPAGGTDVTWTALAGYLRCACGPRAALSLRGETFDDADGARTGVQQRLWSVTLTPEWRLSPRVLLRGDVRIDGSDHEVFAKHDGTFSKQQPTACLQVLFAR